MDDTTNPVDCRVDWLTVTCTKDNKRNHFFNFGLEMVKLAAKDNLPPRPWRWKGYDGQHAQGCTFGRRADSDILQLSGPLADEYFDLAWQHADNCTRLDMAVTVRVEGDIGSVIAKHQEECLTWKREKPRTLSVNCIYAEGRPATLYLGQRVSELFCRIYDKRLESGEPDYDGCLRYEVEAKGPTAERAASWLGSSGDRASCIRDGVYKYCVQRGLSPRFSGVGGAVHLKTIRAASDTDSRLRWLSESVSPVVQRLLPAVGPERVLSALGVPRTFSEMVRLGFLVDRDHHRDPLNEGEDDD